jgi:hypothetical protein
MYLLIHASTHKQFTKVQANSIHNKNLIGRARLLHLEDIAVGGYFDVILCSIYRALQLVYH